MNDVSKFAEYCEQVDKVYPDKTYKEFWHGLASEIDSSYITKLFVNDLQFRADHQKNFVGSLEGAQGVGKSLFANALAFILGNIFGYPFVIERDIFIDPSELDSALRVDADRRTYLYDEQKDFNTGVGSSTTNLKLKEYEEKCRYTQKNLIYVSPTVLDHAHYFVFKQFQHDPERIENKTCAVCYKKQDCLLNKYSTLCEIPFNMREGYPICFKFMLLTKRLSDGKFMPRGVVSLPIIKPEYALRYNNVKAKNIKKFEQYQSDGFKNILKEVAEFVKSEQNNLLFKVTSKTGITKYKIENIKVVETYFLQYFDKSRFSMKEVENLIGYARQQLRHVCETLNNS